MQPKHCGHLSYPTHLHILSSFHHLFSCLLFFSSLASVVRSFVCSFFFFLSSSPCPCLLYTCPLLHYWPCSKITTLILIVNLQQEHSKTPPTITMSTTTTTMATTARPKPKLSYKAQNYPSSDKPFECTVNIRAIFRWNETPAKCVNAC